MESFDDTRITPSVYVARAVPVNSMQLNVKRAERLRQTSYLQEIRLFDRVHEIAFATYNLLQKLASSALLTHESPEEVKRVTRSECFDLHAKIKPINMNRKEDATSFLLTASENYHPENDMDVGLPREWMERRKLEPSKEVVLSVDFQDIYYWKLHGSKLKESMASQSSPELVGTVSPNACLEEDSIARILEMMIKNTE